MEKFEALSDHLKRLDGQVANNAVNIRREKRFLPGRTDTNPKSQVNAVTLRSGRPLNQNVKEGITIDEFNYDLSENEVQTENEESVARHQHSVDRHPQGVDRHPRVVNRHPVIPDPQISKSAEPVPPRVYVPKTPFPQSQLKVKRGIEKVIYKKIFDKIIVEIPLGDSIKVAPAIKKYLKDAATKGSETTEHHIMMVGEDISAEIEKNKPAKLQDPGSFRSLCDLGSSVNLMAYSIAKALGLTEFTPTRITIILTDRSVRVPESILEDVPIKINDCVIPVDIVVLKYEKEPKDPLILGRPFLATAGAIIAVKKDAYKPLIDGQTYAVDYLSELSDESFMDVCSNDPLERTLTTHEEEIFSIDDRTDECARLLDAAEEVMNIDAAKI
ncbi:hypothetical protein N665_0125s0024 [Sinapis alba]|nr:hypothetical protein N665_0125s0024 [Sinapis alba]